MYRCCIFDLDGTLLDTLKSLHNTVNAMLGHFQFDPVEEDRIKQFVGDGYQKLVERVLMHCGDTELKYYEQALTVYMQEFGVHSLDEVKPYPGICELLAYLRAAGCKLAVLSNKPHEKTVLNIHRVFGTDFFDIVHGERQGVKRKPDPEGIVRILEELKIPPADCLYVGDTNTDMETGRAAGVDTAGVLWGFRDAVELGAYQPKYLAESPAVLMEILKSVK